MGMSTTGSHIRWYETGNSKFNGNYGIHWRLTGFPMLTIVLVLLDFLGTHCECVINNFGPLGFFVETFKGHC